MKSENDSVRTGIYISRNLLNLCDENMQKANASSRSEFISDAIEMYIAWLNSKETSKMLTPALESVIGAKISDTENRLARLLFKLSVEMAMMMNVLAASNDATQLLNSMKSNRNYNAALGSLRLFAYLSRLIQNRLDDEHKDNGSSVDRKLRRRTDEKKQAHGLKQ